MRRIDSGRLCDAHRDGRRPMPATLYFRVGKRKLVSDVERVPRETAYVVAMRPQVAPSNVAIRSRMIKLYPTPAQRDVCQAMVWSGPQDIQRHRLHIPREASCEEVARRGAHPRGEAAVQEKYVAATPLQIRDNAIGDCVVATVAAIKRYQKTGASRVCASARARTSRRASSPTRAPARRCSTVTTGPGSSRCTPPT